MAIIRFSRIRSPWPPDLLSPYAVSKLAGEGYCSVFSWLYGVQCISMRNFNVFGPQQDPASPYSEVITKFITNSLGNRPPVIFGDGKQTWDFVYVKVSYMQTSGL
jgi:UDP-glucose 4-epimerase